MSARLKSSFDRRGNRDFMILGDDGGEGSCADKREAVLLGFFNPKACVDVGVKPECGSSSRFRTRKLGEIDVEYVGDGASNCSWGSMIEVRRGSESKLAGAGASVAGANKLLICLLLFEEAAEFSDRFCTIVACENTDFSR